MTRGRSRRDLWSLPAVGLVAVVSGLLAASGGAAVPGATATELGDPLRGLAGFLVALPLPGYAVMRAMFAGRLPEPVQQLALVVGLGLSLSVVGGVVLHFTPVGMSAGSWAVLFTGLTVVAALMALARELTSHSAADPGPGYGSGAGRDPAPDRDGATPPMPVRTWTMGPQGSLLAAAVLIALVAFAIARVGAAQQPYPGFTQLWMLPTDGPVVALGIHNAEGSEQQYTLRLMADGEPLSPPRAVALEDGETYAVTVPLPASLTGPGSDATVEAVLSVAGETEPYRRVSLQLGAPAQAGAGR